MNIFIFSDTNDVLLYNDAQHVSGSSTRQSSSGQLSETIGQMIFAPFNWAAHAKCQSMELRTTFFRAESALRILSDRDRGTEIAKRANFFSSELQNYHSSSVTATGGPTWLN